MMDDIHQLVMKIHYLIFVELAESYGHVGIKIEKNSELKKDLKKRFQ